MSCHGCKVLRKACPENCILRDSLQWIETPQSQANATVFLAKFYGRTGLMNHLTTATPDSRSQVCRSLLSEACGRIINPIYGSVGLYASGEWQRCEDAVQAVLDGGPLLKQVTEDGTTEWQFPVLPDQGFDIRHIPKDSSSSSSTSRSKPRRRVTNDNSGPLSSLSNRNGYFSQSEERFTITGWNSTGGGNVFPGWTAPPDWEDDFNGFDSSLGKP